MLLYIVLQYATVKSVTCCSMRKDFLQVFGGNRSARGQILCEAPSPKVKLVWATAAPVWHSKAQHGTAVLSSWSIFISPSGRETWFVHPIFPCEDSTWLAKIHQHSQGRGATASKWIGGVSSVNVTDQDDQLPSITSVRLSLLSLLQCPSTLSQHGWSLDEKPLEDWFVLICRVF